MTIEAPHAPEAGYDPDGSWSVEEPDPTITDCTGWIAFGLGTNLGDRQGHLRRALSALGNRFGRLRVAAPYDTAPLSLIPQNKYLNTVALARLPTPIEPCEDDLRRALGAAKHLEAQAGRHWDGPRDSPRPLDIDLLFWGDLRVRLPATAGKVDDDQWPGAIEIPHPRLHERRFVLAPLADLAPNLRLPAGRRIARLLADTDEQDVGRADGGFAPPTASG